MISASLKSNNYEVKPFHSLELPTNAKKVGHPYVVDMVISDSESSDNSTTLDEQSSVATVHKGRSLFMVIEVKKAVPAKFSMNEPTNVIEMLIYCKYLMTLYDHQTPLIGILTDGFSWHCMKLKPSDNGCMGVLKYHNFTSTDELIVIGTIPGLLQI